VGDVDEEGTVSTTRALATAGLEMVFEVRDPLRAGAVVGDGAGIVRLGRPR
jgi:hypothetical protein